MTDRVGESPDGRNWATVTMAVLGLMPLAVQPALVSCLTEFGKFDARSAGFIASAQGFGILAATIGSIFWGSRLDGRVVCRFGLALLIVGNIVSIPLRGAAAIEAVQFITGCASGLLLSRGYAFAGASSNPERVYGYVIAGAAAVGTVGVLLLPLSAARLGMGAAFGSLAMAGVLASPAVAFLPARRTDKAGAPSLSLPGARGTLKLASATCLFIGLGTIWAFVAEIGLLSGVSTRAVSIGLGISQLASVGGALLVGPVSRWVANEPLLVIGLALTIGSLILMSGEMSALSYGISISGFNAASNISLAVAVAAVAIAEERAPLTDIVAALQVGGFAVGPAIAAAIVSPGDYSSVRLLAIALMAASALLAYGEKLTRRIPGSQSPTPQRR